MQLQLIQFLNAANLEPFQSGFTAYHSTESAFLKVFNDILLDDSKNAVLILDLTTAFESVDHNVLIWHVEHFISIKGTALLWFSSYLKGRSFSVALGKLS